MRCAAVPFNWQVLANWMGLFARCGYAEGCLANGNRSRNHVDLRRLSVRTSVQRPGGVGRPDATVSRVPAADRRSGCGPAAARCPSAVWQFGGVSEHAGVYRAAISTAAGARRGRFSLGCLALHRWRRAGAAVGDRHDRLQRHAKAIAPDRGYDDTYQRCQPTSRATDRQRRSS